jgi:hypothetical protein
MRGVRATNFVLPQTGCCTLIRIAVCSQKVPRIVFRRRSYRHSCTVNARRKSSPKSMCALHFSESDFGDLPSGGSWLILADLSERPLERVWCTTEGFRLMASGARLCCPFVTVFSEEIDMRFNLDGAVRSLFVAALTVVLSLLSLIHI